MNRNIRRFARRWVRPREEPPWPVTRHYPVATRIRRLYGEPYLHFQRRLNRQHNRLLRQRRNAAAYRQMRLTVIRRAALRRRVRMQYARRFERRLFGPRSRMIRQFLR